MNTSILPSENQSRPGKNNFDTTSTEQFDSPETDAVAGKTIYYKKAALMLKKQYYLKLAFLLAIINLLLIVNSFAQLVTVNNTSITNSAQLTIKGDLLNNSGTTIDNDGAIDMTGDLTNNSGNNLFGASGGTVTLNGATQTIAGTDPVQFNDLNLEGSGTKSLQQDILVGGNTASTNGVLSLGTQTLELNSNQITITNESDAAITRISGYIVSETEPLPGYGVVKWMVQNESGVYTFPFGNSVTNSYVPVTLEISQGGSGTNGYISLATYPTTTNAAPNNRPLPTGLTSLIDNYGIENSHNVVDRWWMLDVANYSTQPVSSISFSYRESEWNAAAGSTNMISESALQAQSNDGSTWTPIPVGTVNTAANTVTVSNVNAYNPYWTLVGSSNPLPMTLLIFEAKLNKDDQVDIDWATATEVNNDYFTVEKSKDGIEFFAFDMIDGAGNSTNVLTYKSFDKKPYEGITYYRLKQTDFDGQYSYSEIRAVRISKPQTGSFVVYPNPATDHFFVKFDDEIYDQSLFIRDMQGKIIREVAITETETIGANLIKIDRLALGAGMYFVTTADGKMQKLILQ